MTDLSIRLVDIASNAIYEQQQDKILSQARAAVIVVLRELAMCGDWNRYELRSLANEIEEKK